MTRARPTRLSTLRGPVLTGLLVLALLPFALYAIQRGLSVADPAEIATSRFIHAGAAVATGAIYLHMVTGGVLSVLAPLQLLGVVRRRWPRLHHANGYAIAVLATVTGLAGLFYIARQGTIGGPLMSAGFGLYGVLMITAALRTVQLARRRDPRHPDWAGRLVILALASWFFRVQYGLWVLAFGEVGIRPDFTGPFDRAMTFGFYLPWLALYELILRRRRRQPANRR